MEKITDVLDHKYPVYNTINYDCLVSEALFQMSHANIEHLVVMDDRKFIGIITEHDIVTRVLLDNRPLDKITVKEYVNRNMPVTSLEDSIEKSLELMDRYNAKHVAVFDGFTFKGVLAYNDLMQYAMHMNHETY